MPISIKMPALSPTMEEGTLAKWLVKVGDKVESGDVMAEIETDKATMEFEAVDEGVIAAIEVEAGTENVKVGDVIAILAEEGEDPDEAAKAATSNSSDNASGEQATAAQDKTPASASQADSKADAEPAKDAPRWEDKPATAPKGEASDDDDRIIASPLARRIAEQQGIDLAEIEGSGPNGRIVKADVDKFKPGKAKAKRGTEAQKEDRAAVPEHTPAPTASAAKVPDFGIPFEAEKLNNVRKTIARRLTEAKQTIPHIYLTVDVRLDALLKLRSDLNSALETQGVKLSVNDLLIKALAKALLAVPKCNVSFAGDELRKFSRADISVAVAAPSGLITPIIVDAGNKAISSISTEMKELAGKARDGKLQPHEYQGGTASLSNLGMFGIKQFDAVINPPQGMILAVGAGEKRPYVVEDALAVATVMSATGSFDHRAIDGADGAELMKVFKELVENPLGLVA
ncbi:pyruvate dehydrogenase complex dihydrolipoamide acetyltransferase [Altererythrobacter aurantiacus]|uniref:Acetyltransferase component of pyruvate dehydrogenase complex n=1 Tax=Parapontixanthobacter aurantiacus TaxID=1463599 RepID=A0A844ZC03_9SPHN|nr:pyruvate dehydrogenase complex dihydrolipoamide acetyltransferase [Parapontixanthobacter aurantiacus]MXO85318.1 pyruvate dehydrogenase complex dihydrolipoamide acetyltransferase [Parapontixanthobacter aurantiacus]